MPNGAVPRHIGFIMDGNGRWAKKRGLPRNMGHREGAAVFKKAINWCRELGVECATFYAFSTENWSRPEDEVRGIMNLLRRYIADIRAYTKENIRIVILGDISAFEPDIQADLLDIMQTSEKNDGFIAGIALNYGGRAEITSVCRSIAADCAAGRLSVTDIDETEISRRLYTSMMPPLDLVIRPSGEQRLSNFLIWQAAYAEFVFMDVLWPDFTKKELEYAIEVYEGRSRRFGGL